MVLHMHVLNNTKILRKIRKILIGFCRLVRKLLSSLEEREDIFQHYSDLLVGQVQYLAQMANYTTQSLQTFMEESQVVVVTVFVVSPVVLVIGQVQQLDMRYSGVEARSG